VVTQLFCATLTYRGDGVGQCYIGLILGGGSEVLLYNVIWGRGFQKINIFVLYNMWTTPDSYVVMLHDQIEYKEVFTGCLYSCSVWLIALLSYTNTVVIIYRAFVLW